MTVDADSALVRTEPHPRRRQVALGGLLVAEAMNLLDSTITTVAAPVVRSRLGGSSSSVQWIAAAYTLTFAIALVPGGRLGDILGRRRIFLAGLLGFLAASVACAAAPSMAVLLPARAVQGMFAGLVIPQTIGLIKATFTGPALGRALSLIGPVMGLTAVAGPVLGGLITQADLAGLSWRAVFLVNVPLGVLVLPSVRFLREDRAARRPGFDVAGVLLSGAVAAAVVVPTINAAMPTWSRWTSLASGLVLAALLLVHVRRLHGRGRDPIVEPSLFRDPGFPAALACSMLYFAAATGSVFVVVLYVQDGLGRSVLVSSMTVLPFSLGLAVSSLLAGRRLLPRFGSGLMLAGVAVFALGCLGGAVASAVSSPATPTVWIPAALAVAGVGGGLVTVPFFTAALSRVRPNETGSAAGLLNSVQQLGGTAGVAVLGAVYLRYPHQAGHALVLVFVTCLALAVALALSATAMLRPRPAEVSRSEARDHP